MTRVLFTPKAVADLEEIVDHLGGIGSRASELVDAIEARCHLLGQMPDSGRSREELAPGLRSGLVDPYVIFYRKAEDRIEVIRILHGRRDIHAIFRKRDR